MPLDYAQFVAKSGTSSEFVGETSITLTNVYDSVTPYLFNVVAEAVEWILVHHIDLIDTLPSLSRQLLSSGPTPVRCLWQHFV